jgi:hypothetical protein
MIEPHSDSKPLRLIYFWLGLIATFAYRIIIVLNFFDPIWVKVAWYVGTIGFIIYFWSRYKVVKQFSSLIHDEQLVGAVKKAENISKDQKKALSHIIETLDTTKARLNYVMIFILSALALIAGIILDFVV